MTAIALDRPCLGFAIGCSTAAQAAGDEALYDPAPPPNSAFVRVIDARGQGNLQVTVGDAAIAVPATGVSPYVVDPAGRAGRRPVDPSKQGDAGSGQVLHDRALRRRGTEPTLLEDEILSNPAKSGVYVYNFSDAPSVKLYAPKPEGRSSSTTSSRAASAFKSVNAVTVDLALMDGSTKVVPTSTSSP